MTPELLFRVTAPHFCAGLVVRDDKVVEAAPILRWTIGKSIYWLVGYFAGKEWTCEKVAQ